MSEPFCHACGAVLPETAERCPSCGAPRRTGAARRKSNRTTIAGFLMLSLFVLTILQGIIIVRDPDASFRTPLELSGQSREVSGVVTDETGTPVAGANVSWQGTGRNQSTMTAGDGRFVLPDLPAGLVTLRFRADGYGPAEVRFFLTTEGRERDVVLRQGPALQELHDTSYSNLLLVASVCGFGVIGIGLLVLAGTIATYRRRNYKLALGAGIAGLFGAIPISLILGTLVILLVVKSRSEFR